MLRLLTAMLVYGAMIAAAAADYVKVSDDLTIHYRTAGNGKQVILLVPGGTMSSAVFEKQFAHFRNSKDYKLISFDPRSQGLSTHTSEGNFYEQHGRDLDAFMRALDLKNVVLGGWSYGGFDVLAYVHQFGNANLRGLIMIDAVPRAAGADNSATSKEWVWYLKDDSDGAVRYYTEGALLERQKVNDEFAKYMVDNATPEYMDWITGIMNETGDSVFALQNISASYQDYEADLKGLEGKMPLLYYVSLSADTMVQTWAKNHTPSATVVAFGKHLSFWEHPEKFNQALDDYLKKVK